MKECSPLRRPLTIGKATVRNRIIMAPMRTHGALTNGCPSPWLNEHLAERARAGCSAIIVESACVDPALECEPPWLQLSSDIVVSSFRELVQRLHDSGAAGIAQLWHPGPRAPSGKTSPVSPSGPIAGSKGARPLSSDEITAIIGLFVQAGARAARAGFDAVEIHAAHGYLLHHFVDKFLNRRHDSYGGDLKGRFRILRLIRRGISMTCPELPVVLRISVSPEEDFEALGQVIEDAGFDAVDVRIGLSSVPAEPGQTSVSPGYTLPIAKRLRSHLRIPLLTGGRILTPRHAEEALLHFGVDAVVLGRPLLADPDWPEKALARQPVCVCRYDCEPSCYSEFKRGVRLHCLRRTH
jgi:NADPH2 dehydrogenase